MENPAKQKPLYQKKKYKMLEVPSGQTRTQFELSKNHIKGEPKEIYESQEESVNSILNHIQRLPLAIKRKMFYQKVGNAMVDKMVGKNASVEQRRRALSAILADDIPPQLLAVLGTLATKGVNFLWNKLQQYKPIQRASQWVQNQMSSDDTNDDRGYLGNAYSENASLGRSIQWSEVDRQYRDDSLSYDGVSVQSVCSILMPEHTQSRVPTSISIKTGLVNRRQTYTLTTNASGNLGWVLYPQEITGTNWQLTLNDATFNPDTGIQTPNATFVSGPLSGLTSVTTFKVTGTSVEIQPITSSLNNQGRIVATMNNGNSANSSSNTLPNGVTTARDCEYVVYSSIAGSCGHRLAYYNSSDPNGQFSTYNTSTGEKDYLQIIVQGAQPSTAVLQIEIAYQVEYTINSNVLVETAGAPPGAATLQCIATAINKRPDLRIIGKQEARQLFEALAAVRPLYKDVLSVLTNVKFSHLPEHVYSGYSGDQRQSGNSMSSFQSLGFPSLETS